VAAFGWRAGYTGNSKESVIYFTAPRRILGSMDITQLAIAGIAAVGMLIVVLLAIVPTLSELPISSRRRGPRSTVAQPHPVKVHHHSLPH
jgi:hypothetical protein